MPSSTRTIDEVRREVAAIQSATRDLWRSHNVQVLSLTDAIRAEQALIPSADPTARSTLQTMVAEMRTGKCPSAPGSMTRTSAMDRLNKTRGDVKASEQRCRDVVAKVDTLHAQIETLQGALEKLALSDESAITKLEAQRTRWVKEIDRHHDVEFQRATPQWRRAKREALAKIEAKHRDNLAKSEAVLNKQLNDFLKSAREKAKKQAEEVTHKFRTEYDTTIGPAIHQIKVDTRRLNKEAAELDAESEMISLKARAVAAAPLKSATPQSPQDGAISDTDRMAVSEQRELEEATLAEWKQQSGFSPHHLLAFFKSIQEVAPYSESVHKRYEKELERLQRLETIRSAKRTRRLLAKEIGEMERTRRTPQETRALRLKKTEMEQLLSWMHSNEQTYQIRFGRKPE